MKYLIMIKNNLRKSKVTCVILVLLISIASMLSIVAANAYGILDKNVNDLAEETNVSQFTTMVPEYFEDSVDKILTNMEKVAEYDKAPMLHYESSRIRDCECETEGQEIPILFGKADFEREISKLKLVEKSDSKYENGIYLPYYLCVTEGYRLGDKVEIEIIDKIHEFRIQGFYLDLNFCSPSIMTMYYVFTTELMYEELSNEAAEINQFVIFFTKAKDGVTANDLEVTYADELQKLHLSASKTGIMVNTDTTLPGIIAYPQIILAVLFGFAGILVFIAVVVIRFAIMTYIEQNYKNLGVMEAAGYTSWNLVYGLTGQFSVITFTGTMIGILLSYIGKKPVASLFEICSGLKWELSYSAALIGVVVLAHLILIAVITALLSLRIRKITVLNALREGIKTHSFKRNHFPLEKTHLPLNFLLGLKNLLASGKQNLSIGLIIAVLSSAMVLSFTMYYNFNGSADNDIIWDFIGTDRGDVIMITQNESIRDHILEEEEVVDNKTINFTSGKMSHEDYQTMVGIKVSEDYRSFSDGVLLEGRYPKHDNEICLTAKVADELGVKLNDTIDVEIDDNKAEFLVVGFFQTLNNLGRHSAVTLDGVRRMMPEFCNDSNYMMLKENTDIDGFIDKMYDKYGKDELEMVNYKKMLTGVTASYVTSMGMLSIASFALTLLIICLVLFLLVNIKVLSDMRKNAVSKALGYTTRQLIVQTITGFLPSIVIGCVIGILIGVFGSNTIIAAMMSFAGIKKCVFEVPVLLTIGAAAVLIFSSVIVATLSSMKIRKVTPAKMFAESEI